MYTFAGSCRRRNCRLHDLLNSKYARQSTQRAEEVAILPLVRIRQLYRLMTRAIKGVMQRDYVSVLRKILLLFCLVIHLHTHLVCLIHGYLLGVFLICVCNYL